MLTRRTATTCWLGLMAALAGAPMARSAEDPMLSPARLFDFHSSFWLNLHLFLYNTARAQGGLDTRPSAKRALEESGGSAALASADQRSWQEAIAYYLAGPARRDLLFDEGMIGIGDRLAALDPASPPGEAGLEAGMAEVLQPAAPAYRRLWWPRHDAQNRAWLESMRPLIAEHGPDIAAYETRAFGVSWPQQPIRVDVAAYANWAGGYTTEHPSHTIIPSGDAGGQQDQGLEVLFHEALHTMDGHLLGALITAFKAKEKPLPRDASHVFIFYTAGVASQRAVPGHIPYAEINGLWDRAPALKKARPLLQAYWQPHLEGRTSLEDAVQAYAQAY
jgi:hypothetical protein